MVGGFNSLRLWWAESLASLDYRKILFEMLKGKPAKEPDFDFV